MPGVGCIFLRREKRYQKQPIRSADVVAYSDKNGRKTLARWDGLFVSKPKKGCKTTMLNCCRFAVVWLEDR